MPTFTRATKTQARLRMGLSGPSGSGKSYSSLAIASGLGERIAVIDTERGSSSLYSDQFTFDVLELESFHPERYIDAITAAAKEGYDVLVIDSLSHAWMGKDGALELVDRAASQDKSGNSYTAWRKVTPLQTRLIDTIIAAPLHVLVTLRSKMEYVLETNERGKQVPRKVGLAPVQRDGLEYEFSLFGELNNEHQFCITKSRFPQFADQVIDRPGADFGTSLRECLSVGLSAPASPTSKATPSQRNGDDPGAKRQHSSLASESLRRYRMLYQEYKHLPPQILDSIPRRLWDVMWQDISQSTERLEAIAPQYPLVAGLLATATTCTVDNWDEQFITYRQDFPQLYAELRADMHALGQNMSAQHPRRAEALALANNRWARLREFEEFREVLEGRQPAAQAQSKRGRGVASAPDWRTAVLTLLNQVKGNDALLSAMYDAANEATTPDAVGQAVLAKAQAWMAQTTTTQDAE